MSKTKSKAEKVESVKLDDLLTDPRLQLRMPENAAEQAAAVERYRDAIADGKKLPPIKTFTVMADDDCGGGEYVVEGHLRYEAHQSEGLTTIDRINVGEGSFNEAVLEACGANADHGLPRTGAETAAAIKTAQKALKKLGKEATYRDIGKVVGVSHVHVGRILKPKPKAPKVEPVSAPDHSGTQVTERPDPVTTGTFEMPPAAETDAVGTTLPEENVTLKQDFEARRHLSMARISMVQAQNSLLAGRNLLSHEPTRDRLTTIANDKIAALIDELDHLMPHEVCSHCGGEGCPECEGRGWTTK